jgi:hypothetical protein
MKIHCRPFVPSEASFSRHQSPCGLLDKSPRQICNVAEMLFPAIFISGSGTGSVLFREPERAADPKLDIGLCAGNCGEGGQFSESPGWQLVLTSIHRWLLVSWGPKSRWQDLPGALYSARNGKWPTTGIAATMNVKSTDRFR